MVILNEKENLLAGESTAAALEYISRNSRLEVKLDNIIVVDSSDCDGNTFYKTVCHEYDMNVEAGRGPHLIIDLTRCREVLSAAKLFIQKMGLPAISTSQETTDISKWLSEETNQEFYLQLLHPQDMIPQIIRILALASELTSAAILYDESFGSVIKSDCLLRDIPARQIVINVEVTTSLRQLMVELRELDVFNYFVLGSLLTARSIIDSSDCSTYYEKKFGWYIITQDDGQLRSSCRNITLLFIKPDPGPINREKFINLQSSYSLKTPSHITSAFYFDAVVKSLLAFRSVLASNSWVTSNFSHSLCADHKNSSSFDDRTVDFKRYFKEIYEPVMYAPFYINPNGKGFMDFTMRLEVVTIQGDKEDVERVGVWRPGSEASLNLKNIDAVSSRTIYKVVTVLQQPFVIKTIDDAGNENFTGYCIDLLNHISQIIGFEYEVYVAPDNSFGTMDEKGRWGGLIKELMDKKADIGLTSLSITAERENVVEFTVPYYDLVGMSILMKRHNPKTSHFKFLTAMEGDVWLCVLVTYVFASFLLWMFDRLGPRTMVSHSSEEQELLNKESLSLKDCLWFCMTSLTPQGGESGPRNLPGYITLGTWWLFGFIIISSYTANLAAFLTVSRMDTRIQSLSDLAKQSGIQYAPINGSSGMTYFERMADIEQTFHEKWLNLTFREELSDQERAMFAVWEYPISSKYTRLWKAMKEAGLPSTQEEAVERVLASKSSTDGFAYIGDGTNIRYQCIINCDLQMVGEEFGKLPLGIALQKNSPIKETLNKAIVHLLNQRRLEKLKEVWWDENPERKDCEHHDDLTKEEGIYLSNIGGVYTLIVMGMMLACFTLVFEYYDPNNSNASSTTESSDKERASTSSTDRFHSYPFQHWID
ncbi:hypothetical protein J6590_018262 [Homalodisca vitripennis]|nr:hypothetical protein J6590_018262 [Homalodisca vitripennis]